MELEQSVDELKGRTVIIEIIKDLEEKMKHQTPHRHTDTHTRDTIFSRLHFPEQL